MDCAVDFLKITELALQIALSKEKICFKRCSPNNHWLALASVG